MKVARLSALCTGHLTIAPPPVDTPGTPFCHRLGWPQGHSAARRIVRNSHFPCYPIWNQPCDLQACSTCLKQLHHHVPQSWISNSPFLMSCTRMQSICVPYSQSFLYHTTVTHWCNFVVSIEHLMEEGEYAVQLYVHVSPERGKKNSSAVGVWTEHCPGCSRSLAIKLLTTIC